MTIWGGPCWSFECGLGKPFLKNGAIPPCRCRRGSTCSAESRARLSWRKDKDCLPQNKVTKRKRESFDIAKDARFWPLRPIKGLKQPLFKVLIGWCDLANEKLVQCCGVGNNCTWWRKRERIGLKNNWSSTNLHRIQIQRQWRKLASQNLSKDTKTFVYKICNVCS